MFSQQRQIIERKELKRLAVIKRPDGEILRVSLDQATDSTGERATYVTMRPWNVVGPERHAPSPYAIVVLPAEIAGLRDALALAADLIPAHEAPDLIPDLPTQPSAGAP
jgi:hypothetical protein